MSHVTEDDLEFYGRMANRVNSLLQLPDISRNEIKENFSKVLAL